MNAKEMIGKVNFMKECVSLFEFGMSFLDRVMYKGQEVCDKAFMHGVPETMCCKPYVPVENVMEHFQNRNDRFKGKDVQYILYEIGKETKRDDMKKDFEEYKAFLDDYYKNDEEKQKEEEEKENLKSNRVDIFKMKDLLNDSQIYSGYSIVDMAERLTEEGAGEWWINVNDLISAFVDNNSIFYGYTVKCFLDIAMRKKNKDGSCVCPGFDMVNECRLNRMQNNGKPFPQYDSLDRYFKGLMEESEKEEKEETFGEKDMKNEDANVNKENADCDEEKFDVPEDAEMDDEFKPEWDVKITAMCSSCGKEISFRLEEDNECDRDYTIWYCPHCGDEMNKGISPWKIFR